MKLPIVYSILFAILFCFVTSNMVYLGFLNDRFVTYTKSPFIHLYGAGIYQYRILSKWLVLELDQVIDPSGTQFFRSVFYLNTFFLILAGITTALLVNLKEAFILNRSEKYFIIVLVPLFINITQYTIVPYDVSGYFFQLLIMCMFLAYYNTRYILAIVCICILLVLSTLNRESSAISVTFMITVLILRDGFKMKALASMCIFTWSFLLTYIYLRVAIVDKPYNAISLFVRYFTKYPNLLGILFWLLVGIFVYNCSNDRRNKISIILFHILSLPYIFTVFYSGILWEMRLYIPLFLGALFLSKLNLENAFYQAKPLNYFAKLEGLL